MQNMKNYETIMEVMIMDVLKKMDLNKNAFFALDENIVDYEILQMLWKLHKISEINHCLQSKIISVRPKAQLCIQSQNFCKERWIAAYGNGTVQIDGSIIPVNRVVSMIIPEGTGYWLTNTDEKDALIIIEIQIVDNLVCGYERNDNLVSEIKMFLTDCDGCLTDGGMYYSEFGDELKKFNTRDGMGFALLQKRGIITGIVTSEEVDMNRRRGEKLKLDILETGCRDKMAVVKSLCQRYGVALENVCYIGDDINDFEVIKTVGYGCCPADAMHSIRKAAKYVTKTKGGEGAIREVVERILQNKRK